MANQNDVLQALSTKEGAASPSELAADIKSTDATVTTFLNRLKKKGHVEGSGKQWVITEPGRAALASGEGVPVTKEDLGEDELSKFKRYGSLAGVEGDLITAAAELFQNYSMRDMEEFDRVMAEMNIPQVNRGRWKNLYRGYLRNTTPQEIREQLYPLPKPEESTEKGEEPVVGERTKGESLDYIVEGNEILRSERGLGDFTFRQALQVVAAKRGTIAQPQTGGGLGSFTDFAEAVAKLNPSTPITAQDLLDVAARLNELRGGGDAQPLPGAYVDEEGNVHKLEPGQPIVVKRVIQQPSRTYMINPETQQLEEHESGKPIVIQLKSGPLATNPTPMLPFPAIGRDGQPIQDKDGHPVYVDIEPQLKWMTFLNEQRRADERHGALMGLAQSVRDNVPDAIAALRDAAQQVREGAGSKGPPATPGQIYECGNCQTRFTLPTTDFTTVSCPNCKRQYTREEVLGG